MRKVTVKSLSEPVGGLWKALQVKYTHEGTFTVSSPLSSTPLPIYEWIIQNAESFENWNKVRFVLMDEMLEGDKEPFSYVPTNDPASYEGFAYKHLLEPLSHNVPMTTAVVKPEVSKIDQFHTDIDLLILALGINGNYANVMPNTPEDIGWHIAHLTPEFRQSHTQQGSQSYAGAHFREYGMSLGHQQVLNAKNVVVIISGEKKRELTKQLMSYDAFSPEFPLSIIHHPKIRDLATVYMTEDVADTK